MNTNKKCNCGCIEAERRDLNGDMKAVEQKTIDLKKKNKTPENKMFQKPKAKPKDKSQSQSQSKPKAKKKSGKNY